MMEKNYYKCDCGERAVWVYMPSSSDGENPFYCDDCVPRGCTCNVRNIEDFGFDEDLEQLYDKAMYWWSKADYERVWQDRNGADTLEGLASKTRQPDSFYYEFLDEKGRRYPCCEYYYDKDGFEVDD